MRFLRTTTSLFLSLYFTGFLNVALEYSVFHHKTVVEYFCCCGDDGQSTCECSTDCCFHPEDAQKVKRNILHGERYTTCGGLDKFTVNLDFYKFVFPIPDQFPLHHKNKIYVLIDTSPVISDFHSLPEEPPQIKLHI